MIIFIAIFILATITPWMVHCTPIDDEDWDGAGNLLRDMFVLIIVAVFVIIVVFLIKKRPQFIKLAPSNDTDVEEVRETISNTSSMKKRKPTRNENQVRAVYQKFLNELTKHNIKIPAHMTSLDVENLTQAKAEMRAVYTKVRYGETAYSKEELKLIKQIYRDTRRKLKETIENDFT